MPRPQFSLKTLLWSMVVVAAFFGGAAWQRRQYAIDREDWLDMTLRQAETMASMHDDIKALHRQIRERSPDAAAKPTETLE